MLTRAVGMWQAI